MICRLRWWSKSKPDVEFQYGGRLGELNRMSSQSHVPHCRVLPLGQFTVTFPEPHATLQGAVTWRNQCHDRATLQGVRIPSAILKIAFRHILFIYCFFWMQFGIWRATAIVSSPIHLLLLTIAIAKVDVVLNVSVCQETKTWFRDMSCSMYHHVSGCEYLWPAIYYTVFQKNMWPHFRW